MADLLNSSIFGELTKNTQVIIDEASKANKQVFDKTVFSDYLTWDTPTIGLNFEELIGKYNITVAAPTIGDNSKEAILHPQGLETIKQRVLNHSLSLPMDIDVYRKILALQDSKRISEGEKMKELTKLMWGQVQDVTNGVLAKLDIIFLGALSNCGVFTLDGSNNPEGGVRGSINYNMPEANIAKATTKWTQGNIDTVDCLDDIAEMVDKAEGSATIAEILMSPQRLAYIRKSKMARKAVFGTDKSSSLLSLSELNNYLEANGMPVIKPIKRHIQIQNPDGSLNKIAPFNNDNIVFIPEGKLGVVKNAFSNNELREEPGVTYSNYGRVRISQWGVGEVQGSNGGEFTKAESLSLPVISQINNIFTLKVDYTD